MEAVVVESDKAKSIVEFLEKHGMGKSHRKVRDLLLLSDLALESYKSNIIISHCCKVNNVYIYLCYVV